MDLDALRKQFRRDADDVAEPYLWDDEEIAEYATDAEAQAAERALLLYDCLDPLVTSVVVSASNPMIDLHESIIWIDRVTRSDGRVLDATSIEALDARRNWREHTGEPSAYVRSGRRLLIYPAPPDHARLTLAVYRRPLRPLKNGRDTPEIDPAYHRDLVNWMLYRAYTKRDADAEDVQRADRHAALFAATFGERERADVLQKQAERRPPVTQFNASWGSGPVSLATRARRRRV